MIFAMCSIAQYDVTKIIGRIVVKIESEGGFSEGAELLEGHSGKHFITVVGNRNSSKTNFTGCE